MDDELISERALTESDKKTVRSFEDPHCAGKQPCCKLHEADGCNYARELLIECLYSMPYVRCCGHLS